MTNNTPITNTIPDVKIPSHQDQLLPRCCMDFDIKLGDLIFPSHLPPEGQELIKAYGVLNVLLAELTSNALDLGDGWVKIRHRCAKLQDDGDCSIYETRPKLCRDFDCKTRVDCACKGSGRIKSI